VSLRRRLALLSAAAVAIAVLLASGLVYALVRDRLRNDIDQDLERQADRASLRLGAAAGIGGAETPAPGPPGDPFQIPLPGPRDTDEPGDAEDTLELPPPPPGGPPALGQVILADGDTVPIPGSTISLPVSSEDLELAQSGGEPRFEDVETRGASLRVLTQPVEDGLALQVARSLEDTDDTLETLVVILLVVSAGGVLLAAALGPVVARTALAPAADVSGAAEEVARTHDLTHRIEVRGDDELGRLAASFNSMMEALERSEAAQRRLVADASHELRTPLATLRANIETLARDRVEGSERERLVEDLTAELEELTDLVADVVELARLPGENGDIADEVVSLDELARDAVLRTRRRARGLRFTERLSPSLVRGDRQRLGRAISNLLDNAAKWSPPGGEVEIEVEGGRVSVRDHGPGFRPEDLPKVFDRFWRSDEARGKPGSGLGLAIVQRVAEEHDGTARATNADSGGAEISIELPEVPS